MSSLEIPRPVCAHWPFLCLGYMCPSQGLSLQLWAHCQAAPLGPLLRGPHGSMGSTPSCRATKTPQSFLISWISPIRLRAWSPQGSHGEEHPNPLPPKPTLCGVEMREIASHPSLHLLAQGRTAHTHSLAGGLFPNPLSSTPQHLFYIFDLNESPKKQ